MNKRKLWKSAGRKAFKRHYGLFVAVCLIASLLGVEFGTSLSGVSLTAPQPVAELVENGKSEVGFNLYNALDALISDVTPESGAPEDNGIFGRSRGVLAQLVNLLSSGTVLLMAFSALHSLVQSENAAALIFVLLSLALVLFVRYFIFNVYTAISRRIFLEGRTYDKIPLVRFWFLLRVKRWTRAALTLLLEAVFLLLWSLTIVGAFIKHYSYILVPYIVAENPSISPRQAITLSRQMMQGHKWECFRLELSFLGWVLLGVITMGVTDVLFTNPYRMATLSEFYAARRAESKEAGLPGSDLLNDTYLFEKAPQALLDETYKEAAALAEAPEVVRPTGVKGFISNVFGVALSHGPEEQAYEQSLERRAQYAGQIQALQGAVYPGRLYPIPERDQRVSLRGLHYMRHYSLWSLVMMFFIFSFVGWLWEVSLGLITSGELVNRGVLHGPWLPIYGTGCVLILVVLNRLRSKPLMEFIAAIVLCGAVEYFTALVLELTHNGLKWWDYSGYFLNLHGRICAEGLLVFGVGGVAVVYALAPLLDNLIKRIPGRVVVPLSLTLAVLFVGDQLYSSRHPNVGRGVTDIGGPAAAEQVELPSTPDWLSRE